MRCYANVSKRLLEPLIAVSYPLRLKNNENESDEISTLFDIYRSSNRHKFLLDEF